MSYTTFKYEVINATHMISLDPLVGLMGKMDRHGTLKAADLESAGSPATYTVKVTNTGKFDADDSVLGFLKPPGAGKNGIPLQSLFGFERVHVKAGESMQVKI